VQTGSRPESRVQTGARPESRVEHEHRQVLAVQNLNQ
jgi:hypothetical protein